MSKPLVFLGMPLRPAGTPHFVAMLASETASDGRADVQRAFASTSLLPFTFNQLWSSALNARADGFTHFAMIHDDVLPGEGWLDKLMIELEANDAEIVSAVVPIKDAMGLTSTAVDDTGDEWNPRRLTLHEVFQLPETFTHPKILLNTGLWVCRLDRPWVDKVSFRQQDRIVRRMDGTCEPQTKSEDWDFSRQVRSLGFDRLFATRKVALDHDTPQWHTRHPWGTCKTDPIHSKGAAVPHAA